MRTIRFEVNQQRIKPKDSICHIYKGTDNYLRLEFIFGDDWYGCEKAVSFVTDKELPMKLVHNTVIVPKAAFGDKTLEFYLVGKKTDYRIQSQNYIIRLGG